MSWVLSSRVLYISTFQCKITNRTFGRGGCRVHREDWVVLLGSAGSGVRLVEVGHCGQVGGGVGGPN